MRGMANVTLPVTEIEDVEFPLLSTDKQKEWVFLFENTSSYTNSLTSEIDYQQSLLKKLRQSILRDGISGKLTEKWRRENPDVEHATELLARIKAEKEQLIKKKKIKKSKKQIPEIQDELLFKIPKTWEWSHLDDMSQYITDGTHQTPAYTEKGRIFLSAQNVKPFKFMPDNHKYVSDQAYVNYRKNRFAEKGDLLVARVGAGIGETAVIDQDLDFAFYVSLGLVKVFQEHTIDHCM